MFSSKAFTLFNLNYIDRSIRRHPTTTPPLHADGRKTKEEASLELACSDFGRFQLIIHKITQPISRAENKTDETSFSHPFFVYYLTLQHLQSDPHFAPICPHGQSKQKKEEKKIIQPDSLNCSRISEVSVNPRIQLIYGGVRVFRAVAL